MSIIQPVSISANPSDIAAETERYFRHLYGKAPFRSGARAVVLKSTAFNEPIYCTSGDDAARNVAKLKGDVYAMISLTASKDTHGRGTVADVVALPGLWVEIDVDPRGVKRTSNGKETKVPSSSKEAIRILSTLPIQPTMLVGSGGLSRGVHAYWAFTEPWYFETLAEAEALENGWGKTVAKIFAEHGYRLDSVFDLVRVLRPAGTFNSKYGEVVQIISESDARYNPSDFAEYAELPRASKADGGEGLEGLAASYRDVEIPSDVREKLEGPTRLGQLWREEAAVSPKKDTSQSGWDFELAKEMFKEDISCPNIHRAVLMEYRGVHCDNPSKMAKGANPAYAAKTFKGAREWYINYAASRSTPDEDFDILVSDPEKGTIQISDPPALWNDPFRIAATIKTPIKLYASKWYCYRSNVWQHVEHDVIQTMALKAVETASRRENKRLVALAEAMEKRPVLQKATSGLARDVVDALAAECLIERTVPTPLWSGTSPLCDPIDILPCANGLLNLRTRELYPSTPDFFATGFSPVAYDPSATCPQWLAFLADVLEGDAESIALLQEYAGLILSSNTSFQKFLMMIGASRGGKGTVTKIFQKLQGHGRYSTPDLQHFGAQFGLSDVVDSYVAFIQECRVDSRKSNEIIQKLMSWVGEDEISTEAKNQPIQHARKPRARLMIVANAPPNLREESPALVNRLLALHFPKSHAGNEDRSLDSRLAAELPGILNWALEGLGNLLARGRFIQPKKSEHLIESFRVATSSIHAFVTDCCVIEPAAEVGSGTLYTAYRTWCDANGIRALYNVHFGRALQAYDSNITNHRGAVVGYERPRVYRGIKIDGGRDESNDQGIRESISEMDLMMISMGFSVMD